MRLSLLLVALFYSVFVANAQDVSLPANFGDIELSPGFNPDPYVVEISAGGSTDASPLGTSCAGLISDAPDLQVTLTAVTESFLLLVPSEADTYLVVNSPSGDWVCDDDSGEGLNPLLEFPSCVSGVFDIWVGSVSDESNPDASIVISELNSSSLLTLADLDSTVDIGISDIDSQPGSSVDSGQFRSSTYESLTPDQIAQCSMDIQTAQVNSGSDTASIVDLYTYQIDLFEGDCAGHPEADAYISNGSRFLAEALGSDADSDSDQQSTSPGSSTPTDRNYGDRSRVVASDGESAMDCSELLDLASGDSRLTGGNRVIANK